jgi:hypothetical protein
MEDYIKEKNVFVPATVELTDKNEETTQAKQSTM